MWSWVRLLFAAMLRASAGCAGSGSSTSMEVLPCIVSVSLPARNTRPAGRQGRGRSLRKNVKVAQLLISKWLTFLLVFTSGR